MFVFNTLSFAYKWIWRRRGRKKRHKARVGHTVGPYVKSIGCCYSASLSLLPPLSLCVCVLSFQSLLPSFSISSPCVCVYVCSFRLHFSTNWNQVSLSPSLSFSPLFSYMHVSNHPTNNNNHAGVCPKSYGMNVARMAVCCFSFLLLALSVAFLSSLLTNLLCVSLLSFSLVRLSAFVQKGISKQIVDRAHVIAEKFSEDPAAFLVDDSQRGERRLEGRNGGGGGDDDEEEEAEEINKSEQTMMKELRRVFSEKQISFDQFGTLLQQWQLLQQNRTKQI